MKPTNSLKAAVIGVGAMGQHHARVYTALPTTTLVGVADADSERAEQVAGTHGVPAYSDYRVMLDAERPDLVTVAVPTSLHQAVAVHAMESGAHVLVEKPIAATIAEAQAIIDRAEELRQSSWWATSSASTPRSRP